MQRKSVSEPLQTKLLSCLIGRGQRELIIGDRQTENNHRYGTILNKRSRYDLYLCSDC